MVMRGGAQVSGEDLEKYRAELGLDDPIAERYLRFLGNAVQGDLGRSLRTNRPVTETLLEQLPATLQLAVAGMGLAIILGLILGVISAIYHNSWIDNVSMVFSPCLAGPFQVFGWGSY